MNLLKSVDFFGEQYQHAFADRIPCSPKESIVTSSTHINHVPRKPVATIRSRSYMRRSLGGNILTVMSGGRERDRHSPDHANEVSIPMSLSNGLACIEDELLDSTRSGRCSIATLVDSLEERIVKQSTRRRRKKRRR